MCNAMQMNPENCDIIWKYTTAFRLSLQPNSLIDESIQILLKRLLSVTHY